MCLRGNSQRNVEGSSLIIIIILSFSLTAAENAEAFHWLLVVQAGINKRCRANTGSPERWSSGGESSRQYQIKPVFMAQRRWEDGESVSTVTDGGFYYRFNQLWSLRPQLKRETWLLFVFHNRFNAENVEKSPSLICRNQQQRPVGPSQAFLKAAAVDVAEGESGNVSGSLFCELTQLLFHQLLTSISFSGFLT